MSGAGLVPEAEGKTMSLISILPGLELPIAEVNRSLSTMWQVEQSGEAEQSPASEFRASQMNLILHFGIDTTPEEARDRFDGAIRFGQRYPCRIIVLCPEYPSDEAEAKLSAKLFTQCYIGESMREMCCCEALILSYPSSAFYHLRNQVTVWLEADLPTFHWFHRVPATRIEAQYLDFISNFRRVLYDSGVEGDGYAQLDWPYPNRVVDIAVARLLPIKQSLGPFLSGFSPDELVRGLKAIRIYHEPDRASEAFRFQQWVIGCVEACYPKDQSDRFKELDVSITAKDKEAGETLKMLWDYDHAYHFEWVFDLANNRSCIRANLGRGELDYHQVVNPLSMESELSESLFFQN